MTYIAMSKAWDKVP